MWENSLSLYHAIGRKHDHRKRFEDHPIWTSCCNKTSKNLLHIDTKRSEILQNPAQEVTAKDEMDQGNDFKASG